MRKKLRGIKRTAIQLDFDLYRVDVPIPGNEDQYLSVVDLAPEGIEETIMFIHGYAGCLETWEYQINYFAHHYRIVAPDLRGHGQSDAPFTQYTMAEMVEDLAAIVKTLELPEKFILIGHSFGGSICVEYADAHPQRLEKLVLIATAGEYPVPGAVQWLTRIPNQFFRLWWDYRPRWNAEIHVLKRMMSNNMRKWQGWPRMRNIKTPTLIITGQRDTYFPRNVFEDVGKMIPNAEVYDVGAAKHKVQLERHEAVNRAIERFIEGDSRRTWRDQAKTAELLQRRPWINHYSEGTPPTIPLPRQPQHKFLESAADWLPKRKALIFFGYQMTYQELNSRVHKLAHVLIEKGLKKGDRVMLVLPNIPQFVVAYYAILRAGGVVVLPNPDAEAQEIIMQTNQTNCHIFVTLHNFHQLAEAVKTNSSVEHVIFADIRTLMKDSDYEGLLKRWGITDTTDNAGLQRVGEIMAKLIENAPDTPVEVEVRPKDLATIIYTSGTTDLPKGVKLTHENLVANTLQTRHWIPDMKYGKETFLTVLPLMHSYGMTTAMNIPIAIGATVVLLPVFELEQVLEHIRRYRPSIFPGVPSMYTAINQAPDVRRYGLSSIKACISGASPLPIEVQEAFEKLTHGRLVEGYGLTEAAPITHANPLYGLRKVGSIGVPIPNTDAKIVDLITSEEVPVGQVGELVVKGPQVMDGYWQVDDDPESILKDGWLYTGDLAVMDTDGYFQIISRKRDTIMAGQYSVYPRDVEEVLYENSKVLEAAVVGVEAPDNDTQRVKAFVVPRPGTTLSKEELMELCRRRLDEYAVPWDIEFREELPKSFVGKVLRRMLVEDHT
ncbi:MAG: alpha/beta fold hydrolase [Chloroflexi bacterium]|nr:alpha/beta fold hydrolase [Chloroflexota bacterium]